MKAFNSFVSPLAFPLFMAGLLTAAGAPKAPGEGEIYAPTIATANFVTGVDNPFFPLRPGTTFVYEGKTEKGIEHNEVTVLSRTKIIMGVTCVVVHDTVRVNGKLEEETFDWYAQDKQGNVWYFGEDSKAYEHGRAVSTHGSWEAGVKGAQPGLVMKAAPKIGDVYRQEYYKGEAEDMAAVLSLDESAVVPYGAVGKLLMIKEWSALEPAADLEHKYYSSGIGLVMVKTIGGRNWVLPLVAVRHGQSRGVTAKKNGKAGTMRTGLTAPSA